MPGLPRGPWPLLPLVLTAAALLPASSTERVGLFPSPLGEDGFGIDYGATSAHFFTNIFRSSTSWDWNENPCCGYTAAMVKAVFDKSTGARLDAWTHSNIPQDQYVQYSSTGYPLSLGRWAHEWNAGQEYRISLQAHIALCKGGAHVRSGVYMCTWEGTGTLEFERDGALLSRDDASRRALVNVTAHTGLLVRLTHTDPTNPLHFIALVGEALEGTHLMPVPTPQGSGKACGGHGLALDGSGACQCFEGYGGQACGEDLYASRYSGSCSLVKSWKELARALREGKVVTTGGLGSLAEPARQMETFVCVEPSLATCTAQMCCLCAVCAFGGRWLQAMGVSGLACFKHDKAVGVFEWWGDSEALGIAYCQAQSWAPTA